MSMCVNTCHPQERLMLEFNSDDDDESISSFDSSDEALLDTLNGGGGGGGGVTPTCMVPVLVRREDLRTSGGRARLSTGDADRRAAAGASRAAAATRRGE